MEIILEIVLPVFGVVLLGYGVTRAGWFDSEADTGLARFVFDFAVPLMLFRSLATAELPETVPWGYFTSYYASACSVYLLGWTLARFVFRRDYGGQVISGFGYTYGNTVLLGLPLVLTTFGDEAALPFFILISVHSPIFFTLTTLLLEAERVPAEASRRQVAQQILHALRTNPILIGIFAGLAVNLANLNLPAPVESVCALMQQAVAPCALFSLGASLTRYGVVGRLGQAALMVAVKTMLMPALVFLLATRVFDVDPLWTKVAVMTAAQPTGVMVYIFSKRYGTGQAIATTAIFLSTGFSMISLSVILFLFDVR